MDRLFFGANKVMQVSLGRTASEEIQPGLYKVSKVNHFFHIAYNSSALFLCNFNELTSTLLFFSFCMAILDFVSQTYRKKRLRGKPDML